MSALTTAAIRLRRDIDRVRRATYWRQAKRHIDRIRGLNVSILEIDEKFEGAKDAILAAVAQVDAIVIEIGANFPDDEDRDALLLLLATVKSDLEAAHEAAS